MKFCVCGWGGPGPCPCPYNNPLTTTPVPVGCICPPTSEQTCQNPMCPRKVYSVRIEAEMGKPQPPAPATDDSNP